jgi:hypothetical protein
MEHPTLQDAEIAAPARTRVAWSGVALDTSFQKPALLTWPGQDSLDALAQCERRLASLSSTVINFCPDSLRAQGQPWKWELVDRSTTGFQDVLLASLSGQHSFQMSSGRSSIDSANNAEGEKSTSTRRRRRTSSLGSPEVGTTFSQVSSLHQPAENEPAEAAAASSNQDATEASKAVQRVVAVPQQKSIRSRITSLAAIAKNLDYKGVGRFFAKVLALAVIHEATHQKHIWVWRGLQSACLVHASPWKVGRMPGIGPAVQPFKV